MFVVFRLDWRVHGLRLLPYELNELFIPSIIISIIIMYSRFGRNHQWPLLYRINWYKYFVFSHMLHIKMSWMLTVEVLTVTAKKEMENKESVMNWRVYPRVMLMHFLSSLTVFIAVQQRLSLEKVDRHIKSPRKHFGSWELKR